MPSENSRVKEGRKCGGYRSRRWQSSPKEKLLRIPHKAFRFLIEMLTSHRQESRMAVINPKMNDIRSRYSEKGNRLGIQRPGF